MSEDKTRVVFTGFDYGVGQDPHEIRSMKASEIEAILLGKTNEEIRIGVARGEAYDDGYLSGLWHGVLWALGVEAAIAALAAVILLAVKAV
jgi:hypothetical protein